jgi:hypothetical protein
MIGKKSCGATMDKNGFKESQLSIKPLLIQFFIFMFSVLQAYGQTDTIGPRQKKPHNPHKDLSLFDSDDLLEIAVRCNYSDFLEKKDRVASFDGIMTLHYNESDSLSKEITIKYRGNSRYQNCRFPPMQINFKNPVHVSADSGKIKKLRMVNQCDQGSLYSEYVLREFLVYKIFNVITDTSFRVRLVRINFIDTKRNRKPNVQYGFFIEPIEIVAKRTNSIVVQTKSLTQKHIVPEIMDRLAIFNYMISNWDWSIPGQHNVAVIKPAKYDAEGLGLAIPFDFDLSGLVNADYAIPPEGMGLLSNRERVYYGICRSKEVFREDLLMFLSKKEQIYSVINDYPYLSKSSKKDITIFLDLFFKKLEKEKDLDYLVDLFLKQCKKL